MTIGDILPLAVGVAVSPAPIIAVILMLFSTRAKIYAGHPRRNRRGLRHAGV